MDQGRSRMVWCQCCNCLINRSEAMRHAMNMVGSKNVSPSVDDQQEKLTVHPPKDDPRNRPAFPGCSISSIQFTMMMLTAQSGSGGFSQRAFTSVMDVVGNSLLAGLDHTLPLTFKDAKKMVEEYLCPVIPYKACPRDCILYVGENADLSECPKCNSKKTEAKTFFYLPIVPRLQRMYSVEAVAALLQSNSDVQDIKSSKGYKEMVKNQFGGDDRSIVLGYSTDGVCPFDHLKTTHSVNVQAMKLFNLPATIREKTELLPLIGLIEGPHTPKCMNNYLDVLVDELLSIDSGIRTYDASRREVFNMKVAILAYVCDFPGKAKLVLTKGAGGESACDCCKITGTYQKSLAKMVYAENRRFLPPNHPLRQETEGFPGQKTETRAAPQKRTKAEQLAYGEVAAELTTKSHKEALMKATGKLGVESLYRLKDYDPHQAVIDMMHTTQRVCEHIHGIINGHRDSASVRETEILLDRSKDTEDVQQLPDPKRAKLDAINWRLTKDEVTKADMRSKLVKVPIGFGWTPRLLFSKLSHMKSHDWYQIYTTGIIKFCVRGMLGEKQRTTLYRLCDVLEKLNSRKVDDSMDELRLEVAMTLSLIERDFPIAVQVISLHNLHHVVDYIEEYGPTPGYRMFSFERLNSFLCRKMRRLKSHPEATAVESFRMFELCSLWKYGGLLPETFKIGNVLEDAEESDTEQLAKPFSMGKLSKPESTSLLKYARENDPVFQSNYSRMKREYRLSGSKETFGEWQQQNVSVEDMPTLEPSITRFLNVKIKNGAEAFSIRGAARQREGDNNSAVIAFASNGSIRYGEFQFAVEHTTSEKKMTPLMVHQFLSVAKCSESRMLHLDPANFSVVCIQPSEVIMPVVTAIESGQLWILNPADGSEAY